MILPLSYNKNSSKDMLQKNLGNFFSYQSLALVTQELMVFKMCISFSFEWDKDLLLKKEVKEEENHTDSIKVD